MRYVRGGLEVRGLPARSAVAELTLYRVTKRDGATKRKRFRLKAKVMRPGARALSLSVAPALPALSAPRDAPSASARAARAAARRRW